MNTHRRPPYLLRPVPIPRWAIVAAGVVTVALLGTTAWAAITPNYNAQCVVTPKSNGGQVLDCDPIAAPSPSTSPSASPSPSSSPTTAPSPTASPSPSTTPSPSPSTTAPATAPPASPSPTGPQRNCLANLAACGFPNADNTGPTQTTTTLNGNQSFTAANTLVANTRINGCVEVHGANMIFRNVLVNAAGCFWAFRNWGTNLVLEDVEITCGDQPGSNGFSNAGTTTGSVTIRRADIHHCENGLNVPGNTTLVDSWIHDLYDGGDAHTDGAQFNQGASNINFTHNVFDARGNTSSAVTMWDEGNPQNANVLFDRNFFIDGAYSLRCGKTGTAVNVVITGNRFTAWNYGYATDCASGGEVWSGNVDDNGASLKAA